MSLPKGSIMGENHISDLRDSGVHGGVGEPGSDAAKEKIREFAEKQKALRDRKEAKCSYPNCNVMLPISNWASHNKCCVEHTKLRQRERKNDRGNSSDNLAGTSVQDSD